MNSLNRVGYSNATPYTGASSSSSATPLSEEEFFEKDLTEWVERSGSYLNDKGELSKGLRKWVAFCIKTTNSLETILDIPLSLGFYRLPSLPKAIFTITRATQLILYYNHLTFLPEEIGFLKNLKILDLSGNFLKELPPTIGNLTNLSTLDLRKNLLETLPCEVGRLGQLKVLYLQENPLKTLPSEMVRLTDLEDFALPGDLKALFDGDKLESLERDGVIVDRWQPPRWGKTVTNIEIFMKNTKGFVDVEELFGDVKNADTRS